MLTAVLLVIGYLLGSINSAIIVCKLCGKTDPRSIGSGNPGASNVLRVAGKPYALATLAGDSLKGMIALWIAMLIGCSPFILALIALAAVLGHMYPLFFKFQGGKGVGTALGCYFVLSIPLGLIALASWIVLIIIFRYASLSSLIACLVAIAVSHFLQPAYLLGLSIIAVFIFWRHRSNIVRLLKGKETKLKPKKN